MTAAWIKSNDPGASAPLAPEPGSIYSSREAIACMDKKTKPARTDWRGADLRGVNLSGMDLEGADMRATDCRGVNFSQSLMRYVDLRGAQIQGANFQNVNLYGAKMQGVEADGADFRGADLRHVNFGGAYMQGAIMPPPVQDVAKEGFRKFLEGSAKTPEAGNGKMKENGIER